MGVQEVRDALTRFAATRQPAVIALTGLWGRGKTYLWSDTVGTVASEKRLAYYSYSYVSLFGLNSLDEVRDAVFANVKSAKRLAAEHNVRLGVASRWKWLDWLSSRYKWVQKARAYLWPKVPQVRLREDAAAFLAGKDFGPLARAISQRYVDSYLVCIDDLERAGDSLNLSDVFGYAALLRDERQCSVLFILNSDELEEKHWAAYKSLREKTLDFELQHAPAVRDCVELVFPGDATDWRGVKQSCVELGIQNIRILQRVKRTLRRLTDAVGADVETVRPWLDRRLPLLVFTQYNNEDRYPSLDFVLESHGVGMLMRLAEGKAKPEDRPDWMDWLREYENEEIVVLDNLLAAYLRTGLLRDSEVGEAIQAVKLSAERARAEAEFARAWEMYHDSFDDNQADLLAALRRTLADVYASQSPGNVSGTTTLFRELGRDDEADEIIRDYIAALKAQAPEVLDVRSYPFRDRMGDKKLVEAMERARAEMERLVPLGDAIEVLLSDDSWKAVHADALKAASVEDFVALFHELRGRELRSAVERLLGYNAVASPDVHIVRRNVAAALLRIEAENPLNGLRMKRFSIPNVPPPT